MARLVLELLSASILPRVEDPWPDSIGLGFPFAMAGAFGVLAAVVHAEAQPDRRDRAMSGWGVWGFRLGALLYAVALAAQVLFRS